MTFAGDTESEFLFMGYKRFSSDSFSEGLKSLIGVVPAMARVFANPGAPMRLPRNPKRLLNLLRHRADSDQMGRGYKISWGLSRDIKPYRDGHVPDVDVLPLEIKLLFHLPNGETCGVVEYPKDSYTFFYKEPTRKVYVQSEGVPTRTL